MTDTNTDPRTHHYTFAHRTLPGSFFGDSGRFIEMCDEDGMLFIHWLWERSGEDVDDVLEPIGLAFEKVVQDDTTALVITCPEPIAMTEAYYVVLILTKRGTPRVFTLEHSFDLDGNPAAISCEWTEEGTHYNKGPLASTHRDRFVEYVFESLVKN